MLFQCVMKLVYLTLFCSAVVVKAQVAGDSGDPLELARIKTYSSARVSSGNRLVGSNDDSKRIKRTRK